MKKIHTMSINEPGRMCRFGVGFEPYGTGTTPVIYELIISDENINWQRVANLQPIQNASLSEEERQVLAENTLRGMLQWNKRRASRRRELQVGDAVWCPKLRLNGKITGLSGDMINVDAGYATFSLPKEDVKLDRNAK